ncbi:MAG: serine/threonine protein kinase [Ktedonobacteraceae bacterium]
MLTLEGRQLGNYNVIRRIRVGGMGAVYEGKQRTAFDRRVAIKVILGNYATDRDMRRRFVREARTVARLHHPHILQLIEYGDEQGLLYLVMPFIEGGTLTSYLRRSIPDLHEVAAIFQQLLDAVEYAHDEGLIHRDIKSSNVLLELRRSGAPYVYLADFGLVRTSRQAELEQAGIPIPLDQVPGTPHYMAPEQTRGIVTTASDIYALGVLLYQMLTGELPYDDPDEVQVIQMHLSAPIPSPCDNDASIPVELGEVVRVAMAKRIEDRYGSVAELRQAFLAAIQEPVISVDDDDLPVNEVFPPGRPISTPLLPLEPPVPSPILERRVKAVANPALVRRRQRVTDDARKNRQRVTEPVYGPGQRKRFTWSALAALIVPIVLLILLIVPRLLGASLFPVGVPLLGADPTTTVSVTPQSKALQDTFLLTASPQIKNADVTTRIIPDRLVQGMATDSRSTPTTGTTTIVGVPARGTVLFVNNNKSTISVPAGVTFTSTSGVQVRISQSVDVPARQDGSNGTISTSATAVMSGTEGNIPAYALSMKCCHGLTVSNPYPFSGGVDTHLVHVVTKADVNSVSRPLSSELQQQVLKQILKQLRPGEVMAEPPVYSPTVAPDSPVGAQADHVDVQVTEASTVMVYNRNDASFVAAQLLSGEATQTLGNSYLLQGAAAVDAPHIVKPGKNGVIYLSVTVHEVWVYSFSFQQVKQWKQAIKGDTLVKALAFLNEQPGVAAVQIHFPFGADHLPATVDQINIVLAVK